MPKKVFLARSASINDKVRAQQLLEAAKYTPTVAATSNAQREHDATVACNSYRNSTQLSLQQIARNKYITQLSLQPRMHGPDTRCNCCCNCCCNCLCNRLHRINTSHSKPRCMDHIAGANVATTGCRRITCNATVAATVCINHIRHVCNRLQ